MSRLTMTRRSFAKVAAITAAVTAGLVPVGSQALAETDTTQSKASGSVKVLRTACRGCGKMECGVWVTVKDGKAIKIEGDDSAWQANGNCCTKSQASLQAAYHPDRMYYPMKRTNPRGEAPAWQRITWDEALESIKAGMGTIVDKFTGWSIMGLQGTSRMWANLSASRGIPDLFGVVNMHGGAQVCKGPRRLAGCLFLQNGMFWEALVDYPQVYVQWGTDQSLSNYDDACRMVTEVAQRAKKFISVDPRLCNSGKEADYHLALRPGSDHALFYAWTRIVIDRELYDDYLVKYWSNAPFLYCAEIEPSGWIGYKGDTSNGFPMSTRLLKESDLVEGGSVYKFAVWNNATDSLTFFDAEEASPHGGLWEDQTTFDFPTTGFEYERGGWVPDYPKMPDNLDPAIWSEDGFPITLKDGRQVKCKTIWQRYWDECVSEWTLEKAAETCDLDAKLIEEACLVWATRIDERRGNGGLNAQLAPEQVGRAIQTFRTVYALSFMTDNYDTPGGNRGMTRSKVGSMFPPYTPKPSGPPASNWDKREKMLGAEDYPMTRWYTSFTDARSIWDAAHSGSPYPVKGAFCISGDVMNQSNATYGWEALLGMEFIVSVDLWHTPTGQLADICLPAAHWLECPGWFRVSQGASGGIGLHQQCINPPADVLYEGETSRRMYKLMGVPFFDPATGDPWDRDYSEVLDIDAKNSGLAKTWKEVVDLFQEHGWWSAKVLYPDDWGTYRRYLTGYARNPNGSNSKCATAGLTDHKPGMPQPTMKAEIWSTVLESFLGKLGPEHQNQELPYYKEPPLSPISRPDLFKDYPFNMTTGRRIPVYFHNEHRQLPWCRELWPVPRVEINPADAVKLDVKQGEWVWIESKWGKVRQVVDLYHGVKPGVINCEHQWWFPELEEITKGFDFSSINCLMDKDAQDPICGASQLRAIPVKIYKATPENCPYGKVVPTDSNGVSIIASPDDPRLKAWLPKYEGRE